MIASLLIAALTPAAPDIDFARWVARNSEVGNDDQSAIGEFELFVDPRGRVVACEVARFEGATETVGDFCKKVVGKRLEHATDAHGNRVHGTAFVVLVAVARGDADKRTAMMTLFNESKPPATFELVISGSEFPEFTRYYSILVDETGTIADCDVVSGTINDADKGACEVVKGNQRPVRHASTGQPVSYVEKISVKFVPSEQAGPKS